MSDPDDAFEEDRRKCSVLPPFFRAEHSAVQEAEEREAARWLLRELFCCPRPGGPQSGPEGRIEISAVGTSSVRFGES